MYTHNIPHLDGWPWNSWPWYNSFALENSKSNGVNARSSLDEYRNYSLYSTSSPLFAKSAAKTNGNESVGYKKINFKEKIHCTFVDAKQGTFVVSPDYGNDNNNVDNEEKVPQSMSISVSNSTRVNAKLLNTINIRGDWKEEPKSLPPLATCNAELLASEQKPDRYDGHLLYIMTNSDGSDDNVRGKVLLSIYSDSLQNVLYDITFENESEFLDMYSVDVVSVRGYPRSEIYFKFVDQKFDEALPYELNSSKLVIEKELKKPREYVQASMLDAIGGLRSIGNRIFKPRLPLRIPRLVAARSLVASQNNDEPQTMLISLTNNTKVEIKMLDKFVGPGIWIDEPKSCPPVAMIRAELSASPDNLDRYEGHILFIMTNGSDGSDDKERGRVLIDLFSDSVWDTQYVVGLEKESEFSKMYSIDVVSVRGYPQSEVHLKFNEVESSPSSFEDVKLSRKPREYVQTSLMNALGRLGGTQTFQLSYDDENSGSFRVE